MLGPGYAANTNDMGAPNAGTWVFTISSTGAPVGLTALAYGTCGNFALGLLVSVDPSGQFAYYPILPTNTGPYDVVASTINPGTGVLTTVPGTSPLVMGRGGYLPAAFDPFGRFIYLLDGELIYGFIIDPVSGALTAIAGSPFSFPSDALSMQFSPDGQFTYVTATAGLYTYSVAPGTGVLSAAGVAVPLEYNEGGATVPPSRSSTRAGSSCTRALLTAPIKRESMRIREIPAPAH